MSPSFATSVYARLPARVVRRVTRNGITRMNLSTMHLRQLLADKTLDRDLKGMLYSFLLTRRQASRRRRHGH